MEEKKLITILEVLADKIDNLELGIYIKGIAEKNLRDEKNDLCAQNIRLKKENEDLRAENERIAADRDFFRDRFGNEPLNEETEESANG